MLDQLRKTQQRRFSGILSSSDDSVLELEQEAVGRDQWQVVPANMLRNHFFQFPAILARFCARREEVRKSPLLHEGLNLFLAHLHSSTVRSEERRVGKECRSRW